MKNISPKKNEATHPDKDKIHRLTQKIQELEHEKAAAEQVLYSIYIAKTFRLWQFYCTVRKYIKLVLSDIFKNITPKKVQLFFKRNLITDRVFPDESNFITKTYVKYPQTFSDVSIIIPTYNGEPTLPHLFTAIYTQESLINPEVIVIDSGYTDNTLAIAKSFDTKIITIPNKEFNHGLTRTKAARHAKGKYLIFTVQDAIPASRNTYGNLLQALTIDKDIAGSSTRQIPYPDSDLFGKWQALHHNTALKLHNEISVSSLPPKTGFFNLPFIAKRKISLFDDVCSAVKKDIFDSLGGYEKTDFAEDILFSIKALQNNYKIAYTGKSGVIHSHTRPVSYFLKRYYADTKTVQQIFREKNVSQFHSLQELFSSILVAYPLIRKQFSDSIPEGIEAYPETKVGDLNLNTVFINEVQKITSLLGIQMEIGKSSPAQNNYIYKQFASTYMSANTLIQFNEFELPAVQEFIDKLFTIILSNNLVFLSLDPSVPDRKEIENKLNNVLIQNV